MGWRSVLLHLRLYWRLYRRRYGSFLHAALLSGGLVTRYFWHRLVRLDLFDDSAGRCPDLVSADLQLARGIHADHSLRAHRQHLVMHDYQIRNAVPNHVGRIAKLREWLLHHVESDGRLAVVDLSGYDHGKHPDLDLRTSRAVRDQAGRAALDNGRGTALNA